eukprot:355021-Chlamydomonas_euryale.AAC.13
MKLPAPISRYLSGERSDQILRSSAPMRGFVSPSLSDWGLLTTHQSCQRCAHEPAGAPREALALADAATHSLSRRTALGAAAAPCRGGFQRRCRCPWSSRGRRKLGADTRWAMPSRADDGQRTPAMRPAPLMARAPQRALRCAVVVAARSWRRRTRVYLLRGNADVLALETAAAAWRRVFMPPGQLLLAADCCCSLLPTSRGRSGGGYRNDRV